MVSVVCESCCSRSACAARRAVQAEALNATHMLAAGVPPHMVSALLGHSFITFTGDVNGQVADQGARFAVRRLSAAMGW